MGVNNHLQSVIFGGVLLREEKPYSFKWVLTGFFRMIGAPQPKTILTDQARVMEVAPISEVMSEITHRWCKWHVMRKAKECIGPLYSRKESEFKPEFHKLVNDMLTEQEFRVEFLGDLEEFLCECEKFEPSGLICCHSLKVMVHLEVPEVLDQRSWSCLATSTS